MSASAQSWLDRTDPRAAALIANPADRNPVLLAEKLERQKWRAEAMRKVFELECLSEGIDPARGISPSLLKLIGGDRNVANA